MHPYMHFVQRTHLVLHVITDKDQVCYLIYCSFTYSPFTHVHC